MPLTAPARRAGPRPVRPPGPRATMCQLLGMNANTPTDLVFSFTGFATRAVEHKDGFGIAFFEGRGLRHFIDAAPATTSPVAAMVRELWGRYWCFAHNGNLTDFQPKLHAAFRPVGDTDSERAFCWLLQELAKHHARVPSVPELTETLRELVPQIARHGTFNFLLSHGEALWAHATTRLHHVVRQHPFGAARLQDEDLGVDFARLTSPTDRVAVIATEPLTCDETWVPFAPGELR